MRVFVTGATGFVGRALVPLLQREGHSVVAWVRSVADARGRLGADVELVAAGGGPATLAAVLERCDAMVNLAGEGIAGRRWTPARLAALRSSRVGVTRQLTQALAAARHRPRVLVSAGAAGYYGDRDGERLDEHAAPGTDVLARLCAAREAAALEAEPLGVRVVVLRMGLVLGRDGGALAAMRPLFRLGVGGPMGSGRQYVSWIHLHDLAAVVVRALADEGVRGPINAVAPEPVTSREFASVLGRALRRPARLSIPAAMVRLVFGAASGACSPAGGSTRPGSARSASVSRFPRSPRRWRTSWAARRSRSAVSPAPSILTGGRRAVSTSRAGGRPTSCGPGRPWRRR